MDASTWQEEKLNCGFILFGNIYYVLDDFVETEFLFHAVI